MNTPYTRLPEILLFVLTILGVFPFINAQQTLSPEIMYNVYLLGNVADLEAKDPFFDQMDQLVANEKGENIILLSGDLIDKNGLGNNPSKEDIEKADRLLKLGTERTKVFFLPGDRDWDNAGKDGLEKVEALRKYINNKKGDRHDFLTKDGCPGPEVEDVGDHLRIISINSQWFPHEFKKPEEEETDCKVFSANEFWEEIEDEIRDAGNRNVLITGHHPAYSFGRYSGESLSHYNLIFPVIGSFIYGFHRNIGNRKDLAQRELQAYSSRILKILEYYQGNVFASGHEHDLQVQMLNNNYHLNSGALGQAKPVGSIEGSLAEGVPGKQIGTTVFKQGKKGFIQLQYMTDGAVSMIVYNIKGDATIQKSLEKPLFGSPCKETREGIPANLNFNPCLDTIASKFMISAEKIPDTGSFIAGKFPLGKVGQLFLGKNLRDIWEERVHNIPYLHLDTFDGGLVPYSIGGGAQTVSIKFKSKNGRYYAFRLIEKDPLKRKDREKFYGLYGFLVKDFTSHQDPYASLVVSHLLDELEIPHSNPQLYLMPHHPMLDAFQEDFAGKAGLLEIKPKGEKKDRVAFQGADKVVGTLQMYKRLLDDNDNQLDEKQFVKCRLFDMLVADYDRHPGNWKWLGYGDKKAMKFYPFPKDRDKVFSVLDGFYRITDWEMIGPNKARYTESYRGLKSLNFNARNMDRFLATSFTKEDWIATAKEMQAILTDEVIEESMNRYPPEIKGLTAEKVTRILKIRRDNLHKAAEDYYLMLAKYVDITASNKKEIFDVKRLENGDVEVSIYKKKDGDKRGKQVYHRLFRKKETKEIRLYGLGKDDIFLISGKAKKSIIVRIVGGNGEDKIIDESRVSGLRKHTKVYDYKQKDTLQLGTEARTVKLHEDQEVIFRSESFFHNDYNLILPNLAYNVDDGLELGASILMKRQYFNKPANARQYFISFRANTRDNYQVNSWMALNHIIGKTDLLLGLDLANPDNSFQKFYGLGNETTLDLGFDTGAYYKNNMATVRAYGGFRRIFLEKSSIELQGAYEFRDIDPQFSEDSDTSIYQTFDFRDEHALIGPRLNFNLDFRNSPTFPTNGAQFKLTNFAFYDFKAENDLGGKLQSEISLFMTKKLLLPITLALRGGGQHSYGTVPFYHQSFIGAQSNHRGFVRNRFGGHTAAFLNTDLRFHLGTIYTGIVPLYLGVYGLYDIGRVWVDGEESDTWHKAYGGGLYMIPLAQNFNLNFTLASSEEEELLFSFRLGFYVR